jgi:hypothetical protein
MTAYFVLLLLTIISSLISLFYAVSALKDKPSQPTSSYAFVRSLAITLLIVAAVLLNNRSLVLGSAALMAFVQLGDAVIGVRIADKMKTYGPFSIAIVSFALLALVIFF